MVYGIRQNIHLILGTGSNHGIRKIRAWERIIADEKGFDSVRNLLVFLASVLVKTEYICQMMRAKELPKRMRKLLIRVSGCLDR